MKFFIIVLLSVIPLTYTLSDTIVKIGGLFFHDELDLVNAFETAINEINELDFDLRLESVKHFLSEDDSIILQKLTCELIDDGVAAIFGPSSKASSDIVEILCNNTGIPHLQFDWHSEETIRHRNNHQMTVNVAPNAFVLSTAYYDILRSSFFNWKSFTIVYEREESLSRMQQLFAWKQMSKLGIKVFKFNRGDDYRILWKNVKSTREKFVVLDCPSDITTEVVNASIFYNMTGQFNIVSTRTMLLYDAVILFFRAMYILIENEEYYPPQISCMAGDFWETGQYAPYRSNMSVGILKLSEKGELYKLKQKWFFNVTNKCDESIYGASAGDSTYTMESVRGIFLVLCAGALLSMFMGTFEFLWNVERISLEEKIPFMVALKPELKFFFKLWVQRKPLHTYLPSNRDTTSTGYSSIDKPTSSTVVRKNARKKRKEEEKGC